MSKAEKPTNNGTFTLSAESSFNNIGYKVTAQVTQEQVVKLAGEGLEKRLGGKPSARLDMVLGYNPTERNDVKRPDAWKRNSIQYTAANADKLGEIFSDFLTKEGIEGTVVTFQHGSNASQDVARQTLAAMVATGASMGIEGFVAQWAKNVVGYTGDNLTESNVEFIAAIAAKNAALPKPTAK